MKKQFFILLTILFTLVSGNAIAGGSATKTSFKVSGNCGMCKKRIEKAAKVDGVKSASWIVETGILTITFDPTKVTADQVHKSIAKAGHDTDKVKAEEEAYKKLHECCQYARENK